MEKSHRGIYLKNCFMKKIFAVAASLILVVVSANSQSEKKEPPPPPPKPKEENVKNTSPTVIDGTVNASKPLEPPVVTVKGKGADDFFKRNPTVCGISRQGSVITIKKKDGTSEKYDMNKREEDKAFTERYGVSPIPPPPPPKVNITKFKPPTITAKGDKADDFYKRNPSVMEISRQGNIIILKTKDGTKQEYNVNKKDEMKSFTDKYGESPLPPPPPKKIS